MREIITSTVLLFVVLFEIMAGEQPTANISAQASSGAAAAKTGREGTRFDPTLQSMIDSWEKGAETNGFVCAIAHGPVSRRQPLTFYVNVINTTTNWVYGYLNVPLRGLGILGLFDSQGKPVEKTIAGKEFGTWTERQIEGWHGNRPRTIVFGPSSYAQVGGGSSIVEIFKLTEPGEYTLHLRLRLVQCTEDKSGKYHYPTTWLPEVAARFHVRPEDIAAADAPPPSWTFSAQDIRDLSTLVKRLTTQSDPVSAFLWHGLSVPEQKLLAGYKPSGLGSNQAQAVVVKALNNVIGEPSFYSYDRFKGVSSFKPETAELVMLKPTAGPDLAHLNHLLLEDAYRQELVRRRPDSR